MVLFRCFYGVIAYVSSKRSLTLPVVRGARISGRGWGGEGGGARLDESWRLPCVGRLGHASCCCLWSGRRWDPFAQRRQVGSARPLVAPIRLSLQMPVLVVGAACSCGNACKHRCATLHPSHPQTQPHIRPRSTPPPTPPTQPLVRSQAASPAPTPTTPTPPRVAVMRETRRYGIGVGVLEVIVGRGVRAQRVGAGAELRAVDRIPRNMPWKAHQVGAACIST